MPRTSGQWSDALGSTLSWSGRMCVVWTRPQSCGLGARRCSERCWESGRSMLAPSLRSWCGASDKVPWPVCLIHACASSCVTFTFLHGLPGRGSMTKRQAEVFRSALRKRCRKTSFFADVSQSEDFCRAGQGRCPTWSRGSVVAYVPPMVCASHVQLLDGLDGLVPCRRLLVGVVGACARTVRPGCHYSAIHPYIHTSCEALHDFVDLRMPPTLSDADRVRLVGNTQHVRPIAAAVALGLSLLRRAPTKRTFRRTFLHLRHACLSKRSVASSCTIPLRPLLLGVGQVPAEL